jgi:hypothetical protein
MATNNEYLRRAAELDRDDNYGAEEFISGKFVENDNPPPVGVEDPTYAKRDASGVPNGGAAPAEDKYDRLLRLYARKAPQAPDYRNERAERFGKMLGNIFKSVVDTAGVAMNGHKVAPYKSGELAAIRGREEEKRLRYERDLAETDDVNKKLGLQLSLMRRQDELAEEKARVAAERWKAEQAIKLGMHNDATAARQAYNKERIAVAREKAGADKSKPFATVYVDIDDGKGKQSIALTDGQVSALYNIIINSKGIKSDDPEITILQDSLKSGGQTSKTALNNIIAKFAHLPEVQEALYLIAYGNPRERKNPDGEGYYHKNVTPNKPAKVPNVVVPSSGGKAAGKAAEHFE